MQYIVRNRRRLRPATGELVPATQRAMTPRSVPTLPTLATVQSTPTPSTVRSTVPTLPPLPTRMPRATQAPTPAQLDDRETVVADIDPMPRAEGSGVHRGMLILEINQTVPIRRR